MTARGLGVLIAVAVLALDQATKAAVLAFFGDAIAASYPIGPFLDLVLRANRGISFSLFTQETPAGRALLLAATAAAIVLLAVWLSRSASKLVAAGLGAIIGGALGNAADRLFHGAVTDFLDLHAFGRHFFVFNGADAAINIGVAFILVDALIPARGGGRGEA